MMITKNKIERDQLAKKKINTFQLIINENEDIFFITIPRHSYESQYQQCIDYYQIYLIKKYK